MSAADDLRALTAAATPGPWHPDEDYIRGPGGEYVANVNRATNTELVVWLRNHAAALTDLIEWANDAPHHDGCNARHNGSPQPAAARPYPCKCGRYAALAALEAR